MFQNRILIFFKIRRATPGTLACIIYLYCLQVPCVFNGGLLAITAIVPLNAKSVNRKVGYNKPSSYSNIIYIFRMCIDHGSNINCLDRKGGQTPLYLAASEQCLPVLKLLLEQGADASIPCQVEWDG